MSMPTPFSERKAMRPIKNSILVEAEQSGFEDISEYIVFLKGVISKKQDQYREVLKARDELEKEINILKKKDTITITDLDPKFKPPV